MKLNLGCGRQKLEGYVNVDHEPLEDPDIICDLGNDFWPWSDDMASEVIASHILEHLPGESFFHFMRELYRVCKAGAEIKITLPWPRHDIFLQDPTHYRPILPATMIMFSRRHVTALAAKGQHITNFGYRNGVDFELGATIQYVFDADVKPDDPDLPWKMKHLNNIIQEWSGTLTVRK